MYMPDKIHPRPLFKLGGTRGGWIVRVAAAATQRVAIPVVFEPWPSSENSAGFMRAWDSSTLL